MVQKLFNGKERVSRGEGAQQERIHICKILFCFKEKLNNNNYNKNTNFQIGKLTQRTEHCTAH